MLSLALSLLLTTQPQPQARNDWTGVGIGLLGSVAFVGIFWKQIWADSPNQRPSLAIVPPAMEEIDLEAEPEQAEMDRLLDAIDFDAELPAPAPAPALGALPSLSANTEPGRVDFELIRQIEFEQRKAWLVEYFSEHKLLYLLKMLQATPIVIYGLQRSGKNTLACTIAALRRVFFPQPIIAASPHANEDNPFPPSFQTVGYVPGTGADYEAIAAQLNSLYEWVRKGDKTPITNIWDEASSYERAFPQDKRSLLDKFLFFILTETEKHEKFSIILASGMTNACLPGSDGTARDRGKGLISISRHAQQGSYGKKTPSPHIQIEGLNHAPGQAAIQDETFPEWLNAEWIMQLFPEANEPIALPPHLAQVTSRGAEVTSGGVEVTNAPEVPTTVGAEVTSGGAEVRVVKASNLLTFPTSHFPTSQLPDPRKLLFLSLKSHLDSGKSVTWVVEEALKMKGRNFKEGKALLENLIEEFGEQK